MIRISVPSCWAGMGYIVAPHLSVLQRDGSTKFSSGSDVAGAGRTAPPCAVFGNASAALFLGRGRIGAGQHCTCYCNCKGHVRSCETSQCRKTQGIDEAIFPSLIRVGVVKEIFVEVGQEDHEEHAERHARA